MTSEWIDGPAGRLDARWHGPAAGRPVMVLHPHPKHGGTKGTRLIHTLCEALAGAGHLAVRFDFRGAGRSEGTYDGGPGETDDALAVWDLMKERTGQAPLVIGFSFGGGVATRVATKRPVPGLILIATPIGVRDSDLHPLSEGPHVDCPIEIIMGSADELVPAGHARALQTATGAHITVLQGADHFLTPTHHDRAVEAVMRALARLAT